MKPCRRRFIQNGLLLMLFMAGMPVFMPVPGWVQELVPAAPAGAGHTLGILTQREPEDPFWGVVEDMMAAACRQLGMKLRRYYAYSSQRNMIAAVDQAADDGVDVLVFPNFKEAAPEILERSRARGLPVYLFNADVNPQNRSQTGAPRERYPLWLGRMMPDDEQAGYVLAQTLIERARALGMAPVEGGELEITGLTGTLVETPAFDRVDGLYRAVAGDSGVRINQVVHAFWEEPLAYAKTLRLLKRYPQTRIFWTASDHMGLGSARALRESGRVPGRDVLLGGIDWSLEGIRAVQSGRFDVSVGGHVVEGAWVAVMLHDYLQGRDFADEGLEQHSPMQAFPMQYAPAYLKRIREQDWDDIDFCQFSRVLNPEVRHYAFDVRVLYLPGQTRVVPGAGGGCPGRQPSGR
ncbi:MAG TPA: ABC transporter substrate-binding protein [Thiolinea sp.]|nr:ABC transporter substrate-binding protein [Thiolinea sp.]